MVFISLPTFFIQNLVRGSFLLSFLPQFSRLVYFGLAQRGPVQRDPACAQSHRLLGLKKTFNAAPLGDGEDGGSEKEGWTALTCSSVRLEQISSLQVSAICSKTAVVRLCSHRKPVLRQMGWGPLLPSQVSYARNEDATINWFPETSSHLLSYDLG